MSLISQYIVNDPHLLSKYLKAQMCFGMAYMPWESAASTSQLWCDFKSLFIYLYSTRCKIERLLQKIQPTWYCNNTFMICKTYLFFFFSSTNWATTIRQHYTNCICASQATIATPINTSQHHCKHLHVLIDRLLSADGYSGSDKQPMHNFQWSDSIASARVG